MSKELANVVTSVFLLAAGSSPESNMLPECNTKTKTVVVQEDWWAGEAVGVDGKDASKLLRAQVDPKFGGRALTCSDCTFLMKELANILSEKKHRVNKKSDNL